MAPLSNNHQMKPFKFTPTRTPQQLTPEILKVCASLPGGQPPRFIPKVTEHRGAQADSLALARSHVEKHGGVVALGWKITTWNKVLAHCAPVAVVQQGDDYVSVIETDESTQLFVPDATLPQDLDVPSRISPFSTNEAVKRYIDASNKEEAIRKRHAGTTAADTDVAVKGELHRNELAKQAAMLAIILATRDKESPCVCGSSKPFRKCHKPDIEALLNALKARR